MDILSTFNPLALTALKAEIAFRTHKLVPNYLYDDIGVAKVRAYLNSIIQSCTSVQVE